MKYLYDVSRPRFWIYLAGTYAVGFAFGIDSQFDFYTVEFFIYLLYFTFPANLFLYGVNDFFDVDTDEDNPKKGEEEYFARGDERKTLLYAVLAVAVLSAALFIFQDPVMKGLFTAFLALSIMYSTPPIRFKARPGFDSLSNILYGMPGFLGYYQASGDLPSLMIVVAVALWTAAMHLYSSIPDINFDKEAGLRTTSVLLGKEKSLFLCLLLWSLSAVIVGWYDIILGFLGVVYPILVLLLLSGKIIKIDVSRFYWYFPYINTAIGFILFWYPVIQVLL